MHDKTPQQIIDEHMQKVAHRVISVFEEADEDATADEVMEDVFWAIGLVESFTHEHQNGDQS